MSKKGITYGEFLLGKKEHKRQMRRVRQGERKDRFRKVWYASDYKEKDGFSFQEVPFFFLKHVEQVKAKVPENMIFGGFVSTGQLRRWAKVWLWLKKISKTRVW